jgi:hypothetical protein
MANQKLFLSRSQLAEFLNDFEKIKQFEELFRVASTISEQPDAADVTINSGNADAAINSLSSQISVLESGGSLDFNHAYKLTSNTDFVDYIDFLSFSAFVRQKRRLGWNDRNKTLIFGMDDVAMQNVGFVNFILIANNTGSTITKGTVVGFLNNASNSVLEVFPFVANGTFQNTSFCGVLNEDVLDGGEGNCLTYGPIEGINTTGASVSETWVVGDLLYANPSVAGAYTNVKPSLQSNIIPVGFVVSVDSTNGVLMIRPVLDQTKYYGQFTKTTAQAPTAVNVENQITFQNTDASYGVAIGAPVSRIVISNNGLYKIDARVQLLSTNGSAKDVKVWIKKNNVAVPGSARVVSFANNNFSGDVVISSVLQMNTNDFFELCFSTNNINITVQTVGVALPSPQAPGCILVVNQV